MPWPNFQDLTDYDIRAIYEYLSAIPCIAPARLRLARCTMIVVMTSPSARTTLHGCRTKQEGSEG